MLSSCVVSMIRRTGDSLGELRRHVQRLMSTKAHWNRCMPSWNARWRPKREACTGGRHIAVAAFGIFTARDDDSLPEVSAVMILVMESQHCRLRTRGENDVIGPSVSSSGRTWWVLLKFGASRPQFY